MCPPKSYGKKSKGEVVLSMDPITVATFPVALRQTGIVADS